MSKLKGFVNPGVVEILNFDSFGPHKSCGRRMQGSQAHAIKMAGRRLI
jgi:hypothetical protein